VATFLQQNGGARVEVAKPPLFSRKMEEVSAFINVAWLYLSMKMIGEAEATKIAWVLSYVQGGVAEAWKDNLLDKLSKGKSEIETVEELFGKIRNKFGKTAEEERKIEQLRMIEQGEKTCNEYVQEFKKVVRESSYKGQSLIEEFKRGLSRALKRKLAEVENPSHTIEEWQERAVRLDRNQRQSRAEERMLGRNAVYPQRNVQPRGGLSGGSYGGRGGQIIWRTGGQNFRGEAQNNWGGQGLERDPNAMDIDRERGGDRMCYVHGKWGHMAKNCWQRKGRKRRIVEMLQESAKDNGGQ